jgi:hypothetical protein
LGEFSLNPCQETVDQICHFSLFWVPVSLQLGIDQAVIDGYLKFAALGWYQGKRFDLVFILLEDVCH